MKKILRGVYGIGALFALQHTPLVFGQTAPAADTAPSSSVIVTGTRQQGLKAVDSAAPIQILDAGSLERGGQSDLIQSIARNIPSFTAQGFGGDTANLTLSARLRGLSPNNTLVLVNGKRRHGTANLAVLGGPYQGGAAADLNFIPVSAIERIEVLQDGAAAQYGTDAIAGVVNIILKKADSGINLGLGGGRYFDGGGNTVDGSVNFGLKPMDNAFINVSAETRQHAHSDRGAIDPRVVDPDNMANYPILPTLAGYPYLNHIQGDAKYRQSILALNSGVELSGGTQLYAFGTYGAKAAEAFENYRLPSRIPGLYPQGFNPKEAIDETDYAMTTGVKGTVAGDLSFDLSTTYGKDQDAIYTKNSGNASLFRDTGSSPTSFYDGKFIASQWTTNLDFNKPFDVGFKSPLNVAFGLEHRKDTYTIGEGDPASRYKEGAQSFPGFLPTDAGRHERTNNAVYIDFAASPIENLELDAAARAEHFSDFGSTQVGKLTGRYDFTPMVGLRGTVSSGFRAPTLAEEYYSATNVGPTSAFVQLAPNSAGAKLVGVNGLKPEKSNNLSIGLVLNPSAKLNATVDAYRITIKDRIVGSGALYGSGGAVNSQAVIDAIKANGNVLDDTVTFTGINIFSNAVNTRSQGMDLVLSYASDFASSGKVDWSAAANLNSTKVTKINQAPAELLPQTLLDKTAISDIETASPKWRLNFGALWKLGSWAVNLRENVYGPSSEYGTEDGGQYFKTTITTKFTTDLDITKTINKSLSVSVGANNLFNVYPDKYNPDLVAAQRAGLDNAAVAQYANFSPFGINGGYYYVKMKINF
jgi:iron complex outermembrane receptor protein